MSASDEDRAMNQALAGFFLNDFEASMQKKFGLTPENCMQHPGYVQMIAARDAMRGELEQRATDGTKVLQPNPWLPGGPLAEPEKPPADGSSSKANSSSNAGNNAGSSA